MLKWQTDRSTYYRTPRTDTYPVRPIALERRSEVVLDRIHVAAPTAREQHRVIGTLLTLPPVPQKQAHPVPSHVPVWPSGSPATVKRHAAAE